MYVSITHMAHLHCIPHTYAHSLQSYITPQPNIPHMYTFTPDYKVLYNIPPPCPTCVHATHAYHKHHTYDHMHAPPRSYAFYMIPNRPHIHTCIPDYTISHNSSTTWDTRAHHIHYTYHITQYPDLPQTYYTHVPITCAHIIHHTCMHIQSHMYLSPMIAQKPHGGQGSHLIGEETVTLV